MSVNTRTLCPGWPKGPCGVEAGTPWTNLYCERCDEKRRAHIEAAVEKNILEPTVVDAPVVPAKEFSDVDWTMYLGRQSDQEDFGDCAIGSPRAALLDDCASEDHRRFVRKINVRVFPERSHVGTPSEKPPRARRGTLNRGLTNSNTSRLELRKNTDVYPAGEPAMIFRCVVVQQSHPSYGIAEERKVFAAAGKPVVWMEVDVLPEEFCLVG